MNRTLIILYVRPSCASARFFVTFNFLNRTLITAQHGRNAFASSLALHQILVIIITTIGRIRDSSGVHESNDTMIPVQTPRWIDMVDLFIAGDRGDTPGILVCRVKLAGFPIAYVYM